MVLDEAGRVARALRAFARVNALEVPAGLVGRAAAVLQADGGLALLGAHAHGLVLQDPARLVLGAERGVARVLAGAGHTRVAQRALRVCRAAHRRVDRTALGGHFSRKIGREFLGSKVTQV